MSFFNRHKRTENTTVADETAPPASQDTPSTSGGEKSAPAPHHRLTLPTYNHNGHLVTKGIKPEGESGRSWINPWLFLKICFRSTSRASTVVNVLWPFVPAAIAIHFARPDLPVWIFALNYIAMVPAANLIGFAGQELARKLPKVIGIVLETTIGSLVEIVLFMVLIHNSNGKQNLIPVIRAAILGSILTNLLLCLGLCFFVGGMRRDEQEFHEVISETGTGLLLVAGFGLLIPSAFYSALKGSTNEVFTLVDLSNKATTISRSTAVILLVSFLL
jgi:Ca2+:H+ antiporter